MPSQEHDSLADFLSAAPVAKDDLAVEIQRENYEKLLSLNLIPQDVSIEPIRIGDCDADWVQAGKPEERIVLYLHGGGYVIGSNIGYREFAGRLSRSLGARVCLLNYRLAPEHPFPAALDDAITAYHWLLSEGFSERKITIAGDSAGGGLALAMILRLRQSGDPLPAASICISPWCDLLHTGHSSQPGVVEDDPLINNGITELMASLYTTKDQLDNPLVSPLYGEFSGVMPIQIFVGTREKLLDDSRRLLSKLESGGVTTEYFEEEGLIHVWPVLLPNAPESIQALARMSDFLDRYC